MTINFSDSSKFKTVYDIKTAQENGKDVFDDDEKTIFISVNKLDSAIKVAELLVKVKKALGASAKDDGLTTNLEEQKNINRGQGSFAWQTIDKHDHYCQRALNRLHRLAIPSENVPTDKTERQNKINELKVEQSKKKSKMAEGSDRRITYERQLSNYLIEERVAERKYYTSHNLITILRGDSEGEIIQAGGTRKKISDYTGTANEKTIKNYEANNVSKPDTGTGAIGTGTADQKTGDLLALITHANVFRDRIPSYVSTSVTGTAPGYVIESDSLSSDFNSRRFNTTINLVSAGNQIGYSFWKVLKDIGKDNLLAAIKKSGLSSSEQTKLGKYAAEIIKYWNNEARVTGSELAHGKKWATAYDKWQPEMLKLDYKDFPHVPALNWEHMIELMKKVFPPIIDSVSGNVTGVVDKPYYNPGDSSFLKPSSEKKGWEGLLMGGYAANLPSGAAEKGIGAYIRNNEGKAGFDNRLKGQNVSDKISDELEFRSLVGAWWKVFAHHMTDPSPDSSDYSWKKLGLPLGECSRQRNLDQIRYARTMKAILKEFKISSGDEFDEYLLKIGDEVDKKNFISPRNEIVKRIEENVFLSKQIKEPLLKNGNEELTLFEAIRDKLIWGKDYEWEDVVEELSFIIVSSQTGLERVKSEIEQVRLQISGVSKDNAALQLEIDSLEDHIKLLQSLEEDEGNHLDKNKTDFQTLYDEKSKQANKWNRNQLRRMRGLLNLIKTKMNNDTAFEGEFKVKQGEIDDKIKAFGEHDANLKFIFYAIKQEECGDSLTETIKKIIKEKDTIATSLEDIAKEFKALDEIIKIDAAEKTTWDTIKKAITSPDEYKDKPTTPKITKAQLEAIIGDVASQELADKWGNAGVTEAKIKEIIEKVVGDDKKTPKTEFISHLKKDGLDNGTKLEKTDNDELWKEFLAKDPERVAKTIYTHFLESGDNEGAVKKEMTEDKVQNKGAENEKRLDMTKFGAATRDAEPGKKEMVNYLWQRDKGANLEYYDVKEQKDETPTPEKEEGSKSWFAFSKDNIWRPCVTYIGIFLLIVILLAVVFWKNISDWWNGPAEEEGAGANKEGDEEETEEEKNS